MPAETIQRSMIEADVALLTLDMPEKSANILSASVLEELSGHLRQLASESLAGLIICSGKPGTFIAGADLREFASSLEADKEQIGSMCRMGQRLFAQLQTLPFVTVAAIDGVCLGGGAELAVWCDRRLATPDEHTQIGFPEVKLGLFPAWGGTARAPRLVGLANAVELITGGESVSALDARKMELVDDLASADRLVESAVRMVHEERESGRFLRDRESRRGPVSISDMEIGFLGATASAVIRQQTKGKYPAPMVALEMLLESSQGDAEAACALEAEKLPTLFGSPVNAALLNVFFLTDRVKKDRGVDDDAAAAGAVESVGVVGAGIMGQGIAAANVKRDLPVVITDASQKALAAGVSEVVREVAYNKQLGRADVERAVRFSPLVNVCRADPELGVCDLVVEAIVENADVKRQVLKRIEPHLRPDAILASNTSTIPISTLAEALERPDRFCGIHFFNPVRKMQLVEVIRGAQTSSETIATAVAYAKRIRKFPIVVNDGPGFLVNRLLLPFMNESLELLCEGIAMDDIERAAKRFGMPMGPLTLYDMVGLDTAFYAGRTMWEAFPDRIAASPLLPAMVKAGRLGQKTGQGFFVYDRKGKRGRPDPEVQKKVDSYIRERRELTPEQITHRLFLPMLLEATRILDEHVVRDVRDVDLGMIYGLGFPPFRGGLLFWADRQGAGQIVEWLKPLEGLGPRMLPTPLLERMASENSRFYS